MSMPELVILFMNDMHAEGISFALEDFGAGQTSFRYLRDFFFDFSKIDGQFTRDIGTKLDNQILAQALVRIANHFEMFSVAERFDTEVDAIFLASIGFDCLQGYYHGEPTVRPSWQNSDQKMAS